MIRASAAPRRKPRGFAYVDVQSNPRRHADGIRFYRGKTVNRTMHGFFDSAARIFFAALFALASATLGAAQFDIHGPAGSAAFGRWVTALPNGNIVVVDPSALANAGAVYLYSTSGNLISTLTGSSANDYVGDGGVVVVGKNNFVVLSVDWNNGTATGAGAVTWVNGSTGLNGVVSASNSLVGTTASDEIGYDVAVLSNGNYVVSSPYWNNGIADAQFGAVTWGNAASGVTGPVSASNSLVGTTAGDQVGSNSATALSNGNYVTSTSYWNNGVGAVTWGNGASGVTGAVSAANSLVGTAAGDNIGDFGIVALSNGNYVVRSPFWNSSRGAATWSSGASGIVGAVSSSNSLVGTTDGDQVGYFITALSNGNYVVSSPYWNNGIANANFGSATWGNGASGITGAVSASNSLIGTTAGDNVGDYGITALSNGNYVVSSPSWNNGVANNAVGAATWGDGTKATKGAVAASNSLIGSHFDEVGFKVAALSNGNYVVGSFEWQGVGAATWGNGATGTTGTVSAANSLVGTTAGDEAGFALTALANGNYVVFNRRWNNGVASSSYGAMTWGDGISATNGAVSTANSLFGTTVNDQVGTYNAVFDGAIALTNGNYVVASPLWNNGAASSQFGATTWVSGTTGIVGPVAASNSLIGTQLADAVGLDGVEALADGNYLVLSPYWNNGASGAAGAVTLASGKFRLKGTIQSWNSVLGMAVGGGSSMVHDYDPGRHRLVVGRPAENIVSLFTMDQIFAGDLEP